GGFVLLSRVGKWPASDRAGSVWPGRPYRRSSAWRPRIARRYRARFGRAGQSSGHLSLASPTKGGHGGTPRIERTLHLERHPLGGREAPGAGPARGFAECETLAIRAVILRCTGARGSRLPPRPSTRRGRRFLAVAAAG